MLLGESSATPKTLLVQWRKQDCTKRLMIRPLSTRILFHFFKSGLRLQCIFSEMAYPIMCRFRGINHTFRQDPSFSFLEPGDFLRPTSRSLTPNFTSRSGPSDPEFLQERVWTVRLFWGCPIICPLAKILCIQWKQGNYSKLQLWNSSQTKQELLSQNLTLPEKL